MLLFLLVLLIPPAAAQTPPPRPVVTCSAEIETDVEIVLPGRPGVPSGSQLRLKVPLTTREGKCDAPIVVEHALRGTPPPRRGLLNGEAEGKALQGEK